MYHRLGVLLNKWTHSVLPASVVERHGLHPHPALLGRLRCDQQCTAPAFRNTHVCSFHIFSSFLMISFSLSVIVTVVHFHALRTIRTDSHSIRSSRAWGLYNIAFVERCEYSDVRCQLPSSNFVTDFYILFYAVHRWVDAGNRLGCPLRLVKMCPTRRGDNAVGVSKRRTEARVERPWDSRLLFMAARNALGEN